MLGGGECSLGIRGQATSCCCYRVSKFVWVFSSFTDLRTPVKEDPCEFVSRCLGVGCGGAPVPGLDVPWNSQALTSPPICFGVVPPRWWRGRGPERGSKAQMIPTCGEKSCEQKLQKMIRVPQFDHCFAIWLKGKRHICKMLVVTGSAWGLCQL